MIAASLTLREFCQRFRIGTDKARGMIARGELAAINTATALCGKPRWIMTPEAVEAFEARRRGGPVVKAVKKAKRSKRVIEFF